MNWYNRHIKIAMPVKREWTDEELKKMEELIKSGILIRDVAKYFGVDSSTITRLNRKYKWRNFRSGSLINDQMAEKIKRLHINERLNPKEISEIIGINERTINTFLYKNKLKIDLREERRWSPTPEEERQIDKWYKAPPEGEGRSVAWVAKQFGISSQTLIKWFNQTGRDIRSRQEQSEYFKINPNSLKNLKSRKSQVPSDVQRQIINMYKAKEDGGKQMTMSAVASYFNLNMGAVRTVLNNNNISLRRRSNLTSSQEQHIFNLYKSLEDGGKGLNFVEIAKYIGKPGYDKGISSIVKRLAKEEGYSLRANPHAKTILTSDDIERFLSMWDQGVGISNLTKEFGIQYEEAYRLLDKYGKGYDKRVWRFNPSPEDAQYILELLEGGESMSSIANLFDVTNSTIANWLESKGHKEKEIASVNKYVDEAPLIAYMYNSFEDGGLGMTMQAIATDLGMSLPAVQTALSRQNVRSRPSANEPISILEEDKNKIVDMYEQGMSMNDIGNEFGFSTTVVNRVLREKDFQIRNQSESKIAWWQRYFDQHPGGFEAYLSQFPEDVQKNIWGAINAQRRKGISRVSFNLRKIINNHTYPDEVQQGVSV